MERFRSLNETQAVQNWWERKIIDEQDRTPQSRFERMREEFVELENAIGNVDGSFERNYQAGLELADVFIIGFSLADALGFDIERLIHEKLDKNFYKYNPEQAKQLKEKGLSWQETMKFLKERWSDQK